MYMYSWLTGRTKLGTPSFEQESGSDRQVVVQYAWL